MFNKRGAIRSICKRDEKATVDGPGCGELTLRLIKIDTAKAPIRTVKRLHD
jgi:hypothetical protein